MFEVGAGTGINDADLQPGKNGKKASKKTTGKQGKTTAKKDASAGVAGRKDGGIEASIEMGVLKKRAGELAVLFKKKKDAAEAYNIGRKAVAEASGLMSSVVDRFIKARAESKFAAKQREYEQLSLVFAELGE